ncbi:MAG: hypothetical protein ACRDJN_18885 [Chloroflexota bacterium]
MIDAQAGTQLGSLARGQIDGVDIARQVYAARGRRAVSVHTHPHSSSFSPADANLLSKARDVCAVVVVGADGTWYLLSIEPGKALPADATIEGAYRITRQSLIPKYLALVQSQAMTRARAWQEHSHEVWERIAPVLGLRYDRIEVKRKK